MNIPPVEPAALEDVRELADLFATLREEENGTPFDRLKHETGIRFVLEHPSHGRIFVIRDAMRIIGAVSVTYSISTAEGGFVVLVENLGVASEYRGRGYGSRLLGHALEDAKAKRFLRVTLLPEGIPTQLRSFFSKRGFVDSEMIALRLNLAY